MLRGVHHAGVTVADLERSLTFYRDLLGLDVLFVMERTDETIGAVVGYPGARIKIAFLAIPGSTTRLELLQYLEPTGSGGDGETYRPGAGHVCFSVDDIDALYRRLADAGYLPRSGAPVTIAQGPNTGVKALYVRDPDGYTVELHQPPPGR